MNFGPHQAKAPVTNATHVKPSVDNMNDGFRHISSHSDEINLKLKIFLGIL